MSGESQVTLILIIASFVQKIFHMCHRTSEINCSKKLCYKVILFLPGRGVGDSGRAFCLLKCYAT